MTNYEKLISNKTKEYREKFDCSDLNVDFIKYFNSQERITVSFCDSEGKECEVKRGRIGVTTGWKPVFLLMLTTRSIGSVWAIGKNDKVKI